MATQTGCPICRSPQCMILSESEPASFKCEVCGSFKLSGSLRSGKLARDANVLDPIQRAVLSHRVREANDAGRDPPILKTYDVDDVIANGRLPSPALQATKIVKFVGDRVAATGKPIHAIEPSFHAVVGSPNRDFGLGIARQLVDAGYLSAIPCGDASSPNEVIEVDLTLAGWQQYEAERHGQTVGNYGFIALKFGDSVLDGFLSETIKPAVQTLGYDLVDMRDVSKAGVIDNLIRAQIRDAAFVLVDLTHDNYGAYWEAGFAEGLGKHVLYICERSKFDEAGTHFDTNHCTTVLWDPADPGRFSEQLVATLRRSLGLFAT